MVCKMAPVFVNLSCRAVQWKYKSVSDYFFEWCSFFCTDMILTDQSKHFLFTILLPLQTSVLLLSSVIHLRGTERAVITHRTLKKLSRTPFNSEKQTANFAI